MTTAVQEQRKSKTYDMVYISIFTVIIAVCSWISVPMTVPVTLQTFGVLGGRRGTMSVLLYILLGAVGLPVFSGFSGGIGRLTGNTGGYIVGFLFSALLMWGMEKLFGKNRIVLGISMVLSLLYSRNSMVYDCLRRWYRFCGTDDRFRLVCLSLCDSRSFKNSCCIISQQTCSKSCENQISK